jgi:hypothetical protein
MQPDKIKPDNIKYVAQVAPVREVTLHGVAELAFWQDKLHGENLQPLASEGQARLFVSATEARFMGLRFRECIVGIQVEPRDEQPAMYLLHAWNSLRAFAWIERTMFGTPYYPGQIAVDPQSPARMQLSERGQPLITAARSAESREPVQVVEENWQGAIFLPTKQGSAQQLFIAKLAGATEHSPFAAARDQFLLERADNCPTLGWLLDSHFTPQTWAIRQTAAHAKSKTYRADQFFRSLVVNVPAENASRVS